MEDLAHIVTFTRVVKAGSFAAAARELRIADSVASKHVAKLERALGVRLLNRSTRKLSLTEAGATYHEHCQRIVAELEAGRQALASLHDKPGGLLRVTAPVPVAATLGPIVREFLDRFPNVRVELDASNRTADLAGEGFDMAIRFARRLPPNVVARLLRRVRVGVYAAPAYLRERGTPKHPSELEKHDCLNIPAALPDGNWPFTREGESIEVHVEGSVQSDAMPALHDLVLAGNGITLLPLELAEPGVEKGKLVRLLPDWDVPPAKLYAIYLPSRHLPPKVRAFMDFLVARLGEPVQLR